MQMPFKFLPFSQNVQDPHNILALTPQLCALPSQTNHGHVAAHVTKCFSQAAKLILKSI